MFYISLSIILLFIILIITYLIYLSLYKIDYTYEEEPYVKPKYSSHKYSSLTFENGLKVILVQVDRDDKAGGAISFDYGYLDNRYNPGYISLALLSLINNTRIYSEDLENYFGSFGWDIREFYSSFYFEILGGGFQAYLKTFSELTYLNESDERFNNIDNVDLNFAYRFYSIQSYLLEYLIYGYQDSEGGDILPMGYNKIKEDLKKDNYTVIKNIMKTMLNDPSKIKIVLYSHYKMSLMKKMVLKYFSDIIQRKKLKNDINELYAYNTSEFTTKKIIYFPISNRGINFVEIDFFLNNENTTYNQLIKDSKYLNYIIYILNQTNEGSLYHELNNENKNIYIDSLSSSYEIILKNRIRFSIYILLTHYSYNYIPEIITKVYNYMNDIILYINNFNDSINDTRIEELQRISEQIFTFTEDAHETLFFQNIAINLFYKDEKDYLLKQEWFTKQNFIKNINTVKNYFNQLNINNSVIFLGINEATIIKYNLPQSNIGFIFQNKDITNFFGITYSSNNIDEHFSISYDNDFTTLLNPEKNDFISKYDYNSDLEYNSSDYDNYFKTIHKEISDANDNYLKVFWQKDTSFHIPKVFISIYFFHPFLRPNYDKLNSKKNDKLVFEFLLYIFYIRREIIEQLADAFRAGGNFFNMFYGEVSRNLNLYIYSDQVNKSLNIIKNIIYNSTHFKSEMDKKFEIYKEDALRYFLNIESDSDTQKIRYAFFESITKGEDNNLNPIYNLYNFPIASFNNITRKELDNEELKAITYSIKYIYIFGYYNETDSYDIYKLFNSTNHFDILLNTMANFNNTKISVSNFVEWALNRSLVTKNSNISCNINNDYTGYFMNFVKYTLKTSCLSDMLIDILSRNENFINSNIEIIKVQQNFIFMGYIFKNEKLENDELMDKIIVWLKEDDKMNKKVDVIGDKFYYFLKGYIKIKSLKHYNMVDSALENTYDHLYNTHEDNNILEFEIKNYENFIDEIRKFIYSGIPFVKIFKKND